MNFLSKINSKNFNILNYILITIFFFYSIFLLRFYFDGHHIGLMYSNALDLINGKKPYQEIFIQYGILTTILHSFTLFIFESKIFSLSVLTCFFYFSGIFLISKSIENLTNKYYSLISSFIILCNHPIPWLPWSNYIAFFFISLSLFLLTSKKINFFLFGFFLSLVILCRQDFFIPIVISLLIFAIFYFFSNKTINISNFFLFTLGITIPLTIFFLYLFSFDLYNYWLKYIELPKLYLEVYQTTSIQLIKSYIIFFLTESFFNFIITPQYFLISIILIFNTYILILKALKKININNNILFICILSLCLSSMSLKIELFRLYTSVIIGIIPVIYFIYNVIDKVFKNNLNFLIILPAIFSILFYPFGNNELFNKIKFNNKNNKIFDNKYDYHDWPVKISESINFISNLSKNCDVEYLDNLTFNSLYSTIGDYNRVRLLPYLKSNAKESVMSTYIDKIKNKEKFFIDIINIQIKNNNIIVIYNENNNLYKYNTLKFSNSYKYTIINESDVLGKPKFLYIYYPKKCNL